MIMNKQTVKKDANSLLHKQLSYNEVIEFLDKSWSNKVDLSKETIKKLDTAFNNPSSKLKTILVSGSNGKSLTIDFTVKLLKEEGLKVGAFFSPHILTYNERISFNNETITNKNFTEIANEVINAAEDLKLQPHSSEILTMMALLFFEKNNVDVAILEASSNKAWDPTTICSPDIYAITRIICDNTNPEKLVATIKDFTELAQKKSWVISADQSKINLQHMEQQIAALNAHWVMPIRKLATLPYPFEQLHGRCAALAERIAQLFLEKFVINNETIVAESLLIKPKGLRGRPTLETKRQLELNPKRTVEHFWKEISTDLPSRFQLLDKEKPSILLDNASNLDAFENLFLGIRLLHYQRPIKGLTLIVGCDDNELDNQEFIKTVRYFFKKTSGQVIFSPIKQNVFSKTDKLSWNPEKITNEMKNAKIKAKVAKNFIDAFDTAKKLVDERNGLIVITGSRSIIAEYWESKGIKKI